MKKRKRNSFAPESKPDYQVGNIDDPFSGWNRPALEGKKYLGKVEGDKIKKENREEELKKNKK